MKYTLEFKKSAEKEFAVLPKKEQQKIIDTLIILQHNPFSEILSIKKLNFESDYYRVRIGTYRVIYEIIQRNLVIHVIKIGHRKDVYRKF